ncbi:APC1 [[Candida] subhashii]|uniref:APC1 n=1 Tax=[Candida] subhashii TaxID=561895 RepID=A0A8J5QGM0_9ASCO|nr:APC1 [[Candida] subhashii]KAG7664251.1 APC1 [[Candida] subhashii]
MSSKTNDLLTFPIINLQNKIKYPNPFDINESYTIKLFNKNRQLLIATRKVVILQGSQISKILTYDEDIVTATYTHFIHNTTAVPSEVLAVCLKRSTHIYYPDGRSYIVSLPFILNNALPFESGLVLERDHKQPIISNNGTLLQSQLNSAPILTLVDPIDDFRIVSTNSTLVISQNEQLMTFPRKDVHKNASLCTTFNSSDGSINVYHVRTPSRNVVRFGNQSQKVQKRKYGSMANATVTNTNTNTGNSVSSARILEDEVGFGDVGAGPGGQQHSISFSNMEKKRTSTLLSDISSIGRMASDFPDTSKYNISSNTQDFSGYKKDMILSKIDSIGNKLSREKIRVFNIYFEDQEGILVVNRNTKECRVFVHKQSINRLLVAYKAECLDCIPLVSDTFEGIVVMLTTEKKLSLVNPFLDMASAKHDGEDVESILCSCEEKLAIQTKSGKTKLIHLVLQPSSNLVLTCLKCFQYLSGSKINQTIWMLWRAAYSLDHHRDEWNSFVIALLSLIYPFYKCSVECGVQNEITMLLPQAKYLQESSNINYSLSDLVPHIVGSLHLLREEFRLDSTKKNSLHKLNILLAQLTTWMGWPDVWTQYYGINPSTIDSTTKFLSALIAPNPPNLLESLTSLFDSKIVGYVTFSQLVSETDSVDALITPRTHQILKLFEVLVLSDNRYYGPNTIVELMCEFGIRECDLETYPLGISVPLKEALSIAQENPAFQWTENALELVGREDLIMLLSNNRKNRNGYGDRSEEGGGGVGGVGGGAAGVHSIESLLSNVFEKDESFSPWDGQSEADRIGITKLIFDFDRRYFEITTLLHQTKTQTASLDVGENITEYDLVLLQRELAVIVALRTLTIPLGRAPLFYAGRKPLLTEKFPIPKFNLNTLIQPTMTNIIFSEDSISQNFTEWCYFHNGVSSGLSISQQAKGISGSWIIFNKPPELNPQHAGFLLGLGLNGHLKKLEEWHIYNYLGPKHPLTSVGLLIGMAASIRGSMDNKLTKVLSVHAVALLPQGANDLNVPIMVQTAGLIGIGLLYLETQHRRMSEILLSQISPAGLYQNNNDITEQQQQQHQIHEGYKLAAGISLGFVNLGKGDDLRGLNDTHVVDRLVGLAVSMKDFQPSQELDKSASGAIVALGFMYIKTENEDIANKLKIPDTEQLLDYIRPDMLLLRCLAKNLIMWQEIGCSKKWVESEIPFAILEKFGKRDLNVLDSDQLVYFNLLGGACMSIAVKYASSHDLIARDTIIYYLDKMMGLACLTANNYDQKIAYNSAINTQNLLALCCSVVMAGSGDLEVFRRLRILYNDTGKGKGYGNYMAINSALGFLFLGGGQYAFNNSNFAIACLVVSLYPIFPNDKSDYEVHLQALRHFWALAVSPRCLVIRDVKTQKPCKVPVTITMKDNTVKEVLSPCLLPNIDDILTIETGSSDYFRIKIDFELNSEYLQQFKKSLTLYVSKRKNYQLLNPNIGSLLQNESKGLQIDNKEMEINSDIGKILNCQLFNQIDSFERKMLYYETSDLTKGSNPSDGGLSIFSIIDNKLELMKMASVPESREDLWNLRLLFSYADRRLLQNELNYVSIQFIEKLKQKLYNLE